MKTQARKGESVFTDSVSDKDLVSGTHKERLQLSEKPAQFQNGQMIWTDISSQKINEWLISTWKEICTVSCQGNANQTHKLWVYTRVALIKKTGDSPGPCDSVGWALAYEPKGHWFDSQSGHMPGLLARPGKPHVPPQEGCERQPHVDVLPRSLSFPSPLSKNK